MFRKRRIRKYVNALTETPLLATDSKRVAGQLAAYWRGLNVGDLTLIPPTLQATTECYTWSSNLPDLVTRFKQHNQLIRQELDRDIETTMEREFIERHTRTLDIYLSDDDQCTIDLHLQLTRLRGLLQEHQFLLQDKTNHYYQRLSERFYDDIIEITTLLVSRVAEVTMR